jgi:hypothetical protein
MADKDGSALDALLKKRAAEHKQRLDAAKRAAPGRGKEPFDLDELEKLHDTTEGEGFDHPREERVATYEELYYVRFEEVLTIKQFAEALRKRQLYS